MSLGEEHNPYAAPQAELQLQSVVQSGPAAFYPMSPRKAAVMSVLTFNIYDILFWYRHWNRLQERGHDLSPALRAIFAGLTSFSFLTTLVTVRAARDLPSGAALRASPGIYLTLSFSSFVADKLLHGVAGLAATVLAAAGGAWVLATVQRGANEVLEADHYQGPTNSGAGLGAIMTGVLGLLIWLLVIADFFNPELFAD